MEEYDFIITGCGMAGLSAGMYGGRLGLKTLVLGTRSANEKPIGGLITTTNSVENYPGFEKIGGLELAEKIEKHARSYDLVNIKKEKVVSVKKKGKRFIVISEKKEYGCKAVLIATGSKVKKLDAGGKELEGVVYCALCDAPLFKGKDVAVVGGSDSAMKNALLLTEYAKNIYVIFMEDEVIAEPINYEKVKNNKKIKFISGTKVLEIIGEDNVSGVKIDKKFEGKDIIDVEGIFVSIGYSPNSELGKKIGVKVNKMDEIETDTKTGKTSVEGIFAAGDVTDNNFKQAITSVAQGCIASHSAYEYIKGKI